MHSIRNHLIARLIAGLALLTTLGCAALYIGVHAILEHDYDQALSAKLRSLATLVQYEGNDRFRVEFDPALMPEYRHEKNAEYFEVWRGERVLARSETLAGGNLERRVHRREDHPVLWDVTLPDGRVGRAAGLLFRAQINHGGTPAEAQAAARGDDVTLIVARDRVALDRMLEVLLGAMITAIIMVPIAAALLVTGVVRRGLRPLDELGNRTALIDAKNLRERFDDEMFPAELLPITQRLNDLLDRLEAAFLRERRFSADAAHELRTPIAELRTTAEVALKWAEDPAQLESSLREAHAIALQMERLVGALLALTRSETTPVIMLEPVALQPALTQAWQPLLHRAAERGLRAEFIWPAESDSILADKTLLAAVLSNILENAVHYGTPGTLRCGVESRAETVLLAIENGTDTLQPDDLTNMLQPFWRKDRARSDHEHSGLGLALVAAYAQLMRAKLSVDLPRPGLFRLTLEFAAAAAALAPDAVEAQH